MGRWLADRRPERTGAAGPPALAVDGKSLRGAAKASGRKIHLLAAWSTPLAWSRPNWTCRRRPTRSPASSPLLDTVADLTGTAVTSDAMHTQR